MKVTKYLLCLRRWFWMWYQKFTIKTSPLYLYACVSALLLVVYRYWFCSIWFVLSIYGLKIASADKCVLYLFHALYMLLVCGSKSSLLLGLSLTVPLMVACLFIAVPLWIRNGYNFWVVQDFSANRSANHQALGRMEVYY